MTQGRFVNDISKLIEKGFSLEGAFRNIVLDVKEAKVTKAAEANGRSLNKTLCGTVDFLGDKVKVFTINGQFTRSPTGADIIEFTMGGNYYGGTKKGTYWPVCGEDEIVIHELMPFVDFTATMIHELVERHAMKYLGLSYDDAHTDYAEPAERTARIILEGGTDGGS